MVTVSILFIAVDLNLTNALCIKKHRNSRSRSTIFQLRKDLQDKHLRSIKESPCIGSSSDAVTDSKLLSFVNNPRHARKLQATEVASSTQASLTSVEISKVFSVDRYIPNAFFSSNLDIS